MSNQDMCTVAAAQCRYRARSIKSSLNVKLPRAVDKVVTDVTVQAVGAGAIVTDSQVPCSVGCATTSNGGYPSWVWSLSDAEGKEARKGSSGRNWNFKNICLMADVKESGEPSRAVAGAGTEEREVINETRGSRRRKCGWMPCYGPWSFRHPIIESKGIVEEEANAGSRPSEQWGAGRGESKSANVSRES